ncbi:MAG: hypothetical protein E6R03_02175 [Hyphomicrobiaceae bacterium]|nr:MAG: hypothetical protein E6R03_02175 [Hyphomicrobiaceae bacterium]
MKAELVKMYNGLAPGTRIDGFGVGVITELIRRGIARAVVDSDGDGRSEGGRSGSKKAFTQPPAGKRA